MVRFTCYKCITYNLCELILPIIFTKKYIYIKREILFTYDIKKIDI